MNGMSISSSDAILKEYLKCTSLQMGVNSCCWYEFIKIAKDFFAHNFWPFLMFLAGGASESAGTCW
jgi:hypothetical protein